MTNDLPEITSLDMFLEDKEGWIQQTRRTEFNEITPSVFDFDVFSFGCKTRLSCLNTQIFNHALRSRSGVIVVKRMVFLGGGSNGTALLYFNTSDFILHNVLANSSLIDDKIYKNTTIDTDSSSLTVTNCTMSGAIMEYDTEDDFSLSVIDEPDTANVDYLPSSTDITDICSYVVSTYISIPTTFSPAKYQGIHITGSNPYPKYFSILVAAKSTDANAALRIMGYDGTSSSFIYAKSAPTVANAVTFRVKIANPGDPGGKIYFIPTSVTSTPVTAYIYSAMFVY